MYREVDNIYSMSNIHFNNNNSIAHIIQLIFTFNINNLDAFDLAVTYICSYSKINKMMKFI